MFIDFNSHLAKAIFWPSLGQKYEIEIETISKPNAEYLTDEYFELDLPVAPAVMVGEEIVVEGSDVPEEKLEAVICQHLGLSPPDPRKKGLLGRQTWVIQKSTVVSAVYSVGRRRDTQLKR